jgi:outer membrane lipoprotein carrier protein
MRLRPAVALALVFVAPVVLLSSSRGPTTNPPPQDAAADLAARVQARYDGVRDFTADFTQTVRGILLRRGATERGRVLVKKPNRNRFTYESPERKEFVADGSQLFSHFPEMRYGSVTPLPRGNEASTALLFLAGRGSLVRDFTGSIPPGVPDAEVHLRLVPNGSRAEFQTLTLFLDRRTLALRGLETTDEQGTNTIRFERVRENAGLADREFAFTFPPGTEIAR